MSVNNLHASAKMALAVEAHCIEAVYIQFRKNIYFSISIHHIINFLLNYRITNNLHYPADIMSLISNHHILVEILLYHY